MGENPGVVNAVALGQTVAMTTGTGKGSGKGEAEGGDEPLSQPSIYDPPEEGATDLWFLHDEGETDPAAFPWGPRAVEPRLRAADWEAAEGRCGRALADAAAAFARLDERAAIVPGCASRLAVMAVSSALEAQGDWLPVERIALYMALREQAGEEGPVLSAADWAVRRALSPMDPMADLAGFLGRHSAAHDGLAEVDLFGELVRGEDFEAAGRDWREAMEGLDSAGLHDLTRAAAGYHLWRLAGLCAPGEVLEPVTVAGYLGAGAGRTLEFVPVALGARQDLVASGTAEERLWHWLRAVRDGCARALLEVGRLAEWEARARSETADLSGRTPPLLLDALLRAPLASTEMLMEATGASAAAVRRNMAEFTRRGLVREATGQSRFRFWGAKTRGL